VNQIAQSMVEYNILKRRCRRLQDHVTTALLTKPEESEHRGGIEVIEYFEW